MCVVISTNFLCPIMEGQYNLGMSEDSYTGRKILTGLDIYWWDSLHVATDRAITGSLFLDIYNVYFRLNKTV